MDLSGPKCKGPLNKFEIELASMMANSKFKRVPQALSNAILGSKAFVGDSKANSEVHKPEYPLLGWEQWDDSVLYGD